MKSYFSSIHFLLNLKLQRIFFRIILSVIISIPVMHNIYAQVKKSQYKIQLPTRTIYPVSGIDSQVKNNLLNQLRQGEKSHVFIQFRTQPDRKMKAGLQRAGIQLINYLGSNTWYASLSDTSAVLFTSPNIIARYSALKSIHWLGKIQEEDKIAPRILQKKIGDWAKTTDGRINLLVKYFDDTNTTVIRNYIEQLSGTVVGTLEKANTLVITLNEDKILQLAANDAIRWIELVPPKGKAETNRIRTHLHVNDVYNLGLRGNGVKAGVFEDYHVYITHPDLNGRSYQGDTDAYNPFWHATNVGGVIAGNGSANALRRGMAPEATLYSYNYSTGGTTADDYLNFTGDLQTSITDHDIDVANNSWGSPGCDEYDFGIYEGLCPTLDAFVRGDFGKPLTIVFSAGNERRGTWDGDNEQYIFPCVDDEVAPFLNYESMNHPKAAKNIITVGAIDSYNDRMSSYSSWGPVIDGRSKPDIVASGHHNGTLTNGITEPTTTNHLYSAPYYNPAYPDADYGYFGQTSSAAAAASGCITLLLEKFRQQYNVDSNPLPSTVKALLIHSAQDLDDNTNDWYNSGPDFASGYGLLQINNTIQLMENGSYIESQVGNDQTVCYLLTVPAATEELKVTLAWDDYPGPENANPALVNDLDLEIYDPADEQYYPWTLDPGNHSNPAVRTQADHINNIEQVYVEDPDAGQWKILVRGFDVNEPVENPQQKFSIVSDLSMSLNEHVSVVQVIDRTGSMGYPWDADVPSYMQSAKAGAQNFIGLMQIGDEVGVVSFDKHGTEPLAEPRFNLTEITTTNVQNNAINSINPLDYRGATSIGAGMELAQSTNFLTAATADQPHAMVLLTDGFENNPPWVLERPEDFSYKPETPNNILLTIPEETDIYTIALGSNADSDLMQEIANSTGGRFYESPTILGLLSIYYQIQGDLLLGEFAECATGTKSGGNYTSKVIIDPGTKMATFVVGWLQKNGSLQLTLKDPNNQQISPNDVHISAGSGATFYFLRIMNPLAGEWEAHITRTDKENFDINYTFAAFVKGADKLYSYIPEFVEAGNCLQIKLYLFDSQTHQPITGASVKAIITSPQTSKYTLHYNYIKPSSESWKPGYLNSGNVTLKQPHSMTNNADQSPSWAKTLRDYDIQSLNSSGESIFQYNQSEVLLYDNKTHGDEHENDGIYSHCVDNTMIAGSYNIRFEVSGVTVNGSNFVRRKLNTTNVIPTSVDQIKTLVRVDPSMIEVTEGSQAVITIVPIDSYGNVWGPGNAARISIISSAGQLTGGIKDNGDGFYYHTIQSKGIKETGEIHIYIDGTAINTKPKIYIGTSPYRFACSFHAGAAIPIGTLANDYNTGVSLILNGEYYLTPKIILCSFLGYNNFPGKTTNIAEENIINISTNIKYYLTNRHISPYLQGGVGYYICKSVNNSFGANAGLGFDWNVRGNLAFEFGMDSHALLGEDIQYITTHGGIIIKF